MGKIIFLDIDGVLATNAEFYRVRRKFWDKYDTANNLRIPYPFNDKCVEIFNEILEKTGAEIVLSSDWRLHWNLDELRQIFEFNKVNKYPLDITEELDSNLYITLEEERSAQIEKYLKTHEIENYVIIDDLNMKPNLMDDSHFVMTRCSEGLKQSNAKEKIIKILNK